MTRPAVSDSAERLYEVLGAYAEDDETGGWFLLHLCEAAARMVAKANDVLRADETGSGWRRMRDPDRAPAWALPWLGQHVGLDRLPALSVAEQRALIRDAPGMRRGTPAAMTGAARPYLTGNKTVVFLERNGSAYQLTVVTRTDETADSDAVLAALLTQKPAGIVMEYVTSDVQIWDEVTTHWDDVDTGVTWNDVATESI